MAISSSTYRNQYTGNGSNTIFAYGFKIYGDDDVAVLLDGVLKTKTTDYTVSGVGADAGGNVTFLVAPGNGVVVTIRRDEPLTQEIEYVENDDFPAIAHEEGLDRSVIRDQTLQEQIDRCAKTADGSTITGVVLPDPEDGKTLVWDGVLGEIINGPTADDLADAAANAAIAVAAKDDAEAARDLAEDYRDAALAAASILTDGDKGDITVSASGATWTIDDDVVTNAKLANMPEYSVKIKSDAGSGNPTDLYMDVSTLLGRGSTGGVARISLGTGLSMSGQTLNASGGTDGTYTPTYTNVANTSAASLGSPYVHRWSRVGNTVTVSSSGQITITAGSTLTTFRLTLPVASNFGGDYDASGTITVESTAGAKVSGYAYSNAGNDNVYFQFYPGATGAQFFSCIYQYTVI